MKNKLCYLFGLISSMAVVSCYPPIPPQPPVGEEEVPEVAPPGPGEEGLEGKALYDFRISQGRDPKTGKPVVAPERPSPQLNPTGPRPTLPAPTGPTVTQPKPPSQPKNIKPDVPKNYPYATPVPGKQGFVYNPYTNVKVDVRGLPSGTMVTDPRNPDQKFYVP